jgi:hypothetical protein
VRGISKKAVQCAGTSWGDTLDLGEWIDAHQKNLEGWKEDLLSAVESSHWRVLKRLEKNSFNGLDSWQSTPVVKTLTSLVLSKLSYREIADRAERIPEAYAKTFEWIFSDPPNNPHQDSWSSFRDWLTRDSSIYWITGKAGSGKSTLMKMLCQDHRTSGLLREWSGSTPLITASFYFWNSGTDLQMSQEGLLRSLLHQALAQRLDLARHSSSMSSKWGAFSLSTSPSHLSWRELSQAFRFLIEEDADSPAKFVFFIDGLDEYSGAPGKLLSLVQNIASYPNVKVCVSSRPWTVFEDSFKQRQNLMLQYRTRADIALYAQGELSAHPAFSELQEYNPEYASELIDNITTKASGVFLWVVLVVRSLIEGLEQGDKPSELQERLNQLPEELDDLFGKMLHGLKGAHFRDAAQLFRIFRTAVSKPSVLVMSFADDDDHEWAMNGHVVPLSAHEMWYRAITMKRRLNSRCKGLLEIAPLRMGLPQSVVWTGDSATHQLADDEDEASANPPAPSSNGRSVSNLAVSDGHLLASAKIDYFHRTVKDFLTSSRISTLIDEASQTCSNARAALFRAYLGHLKIMPVDVVDAATFWAAISRCLKEAVDLAYESENLHVQYLDALDNVAIQLTKYKNSAGHSFIQRYWAAADYHWVSTLSQGKPTDDFYTLAVRCQLVEYLRTKFQLESVSKQLSTRLLGTALSRYITPKVLSLGLGVRVSNEEIVQLLLRHGADRRLCATAVSRKKKRILGLGESKLTLGKRSVDWVSHGSDVDPFELSSLSSVSAVRGEPYDAESQASLRAMRLQSWQRDIQQADSAPES